MAYTPAVSIPSFLFFQWGTPDAPNPTLSAPLAPTDTTIYFSTPPYLYDGTIITGGFLMNVKNSEGYTMTCWIAPGAVAADGLSATVVQGVRLSGTDYTTSDTSLIPADGFDAGSAISCNISGVIGAILMGAIKGTIATNGLGFIMGDGTDTNVTLSHKDAASTKGFLRKNPTTAKVQYSNDGSTWVNIDSVTASNLVTVSAADTTPGYLNDKVTVTSGSGATVTKSISSPAGNEKLNIDVALNAASVGIADHLIYTPAFLTGGNAAEATFNNWLAVLDGSFRITINGTLRNVTGINFTGVTSMADVATTIQTAIRALTLSTETVVWSVNHFIITSALTTSSSAITVTSATGGGTDISGAGASNWMDCDTGNGTVTNAVLNRTADAGQLIKLDASGNIADKLFNTNPLYALGTSGSDAYAVSIPAAPTAYYIGMRVSMKADVPNTGACTLNVNGLGVKDIKKNTSEALETGDILAGQIVELEYDGTNFQLVSPVSKALIMKNGVTSYDLSTATPASTTIAHGLGVAPVTARITGYCYNGGGGSKFAVSSNYNSSTSVKTITAATAAVNTGSTGADIYIDQAAGNTITGVITFDATNITISWTKAGAPSGTLLILWEVENY